jgi:hypothetical protein
MGIPPYMNGKMSGEPERVFFRKHDIMTPEACNVLCITNVMQDGVSRQGWGGTTKCVRQSDGVQLFYLDLILIMHPRNPYKDPPDFAALAVVYLPLKPQ